jgi:sugar/nucleoside kinase (ribokinase family)
MDRGKIKISGVGCALADFLFTGIKFDNLTTNQYLSKKDGDGGLCPGKLLFTEELESFGKKNITEILHDIVGDQAPDAFNLGGPGLVSLIHASQMLDAEEYEVHFYGMAGSDEIARNIFTILKNIPLRISNYKTIEGKTSPFTYVLSDPSYNNGEGERTFVNNIGAAWHFTSGMLDEPFFNSDIVCFGGTALVPQIHDDLTYNLKKAKDNKCLTLVNTVYDFRNEKSHPGKAWPLGRGPDNLSMIDVLIMNSEEARRISGKESLEEVIRFFKSGKLGAFIITNGNSDILAYSNGAVFKDSGDLISLPVSRKIKSELDSIPSFTRDTTGAGDNFAGGIISSLAWQLKAKPIGAYDLREAISWGVVSGGFACLSIGGTYLEKEPGEKRTRISELFHEYLKQTAG